MNFKIKAFWSIIIIIYGTGCVNLSVLNQYASSSNTAIESFEEIEFSFIETCGKNCEFRINSDEVRIQQRIKNSYVPVELASQCDCARYQRADSAFNQMHFVLSEYFDGLSKLSGEEVLVFNYDTLANTLVKSEIFGVEENDVKSYKQLANIITKILSNAKRHSVLKTAIQQANDPVQTLIDRLQFAVNSVMIETVDNEIILEHNYYKAIVINDEQLSLRETILEERSYANKRDLLMSKIEALRQFSNMLEKISVGHQELNDRVDNLSTKAIASEVAPYVTDLRELINSFDNHQ